jgi:hypothetical protein
MAEPIYLETGTRWSFASAVEWPGWCRHAKGAADPVTELVAYGPRYRDALTRGGVPFELPDEVEVVAVLEGDRGTEWGVPSVVPEADHLPLDARETERQVAILRAAWGAFDRAVAEAEGHELRTGPRGGGRGLPGLVDHCLESDVAYLSKLGARRPRVDSDDWREIEAPIRERAVEAIVDRAAGRPVREPSRTRVLWPVRWYVRYVAWHTLIHAWEIEDRRLD